MKCFAAICLLAVVAVLIASCIATSVSPDSSEMKASVSFQKLRDHAQDMPHANREGRNYGGWGGYGGHGGGWGGYGGGWGGWGR